MNSSVLFVVAYLFFFLAGDADWLQWGGPNRNFSVDSPGLADRWPDEGPRTLWSRELGDGYSAIVVKDGLLYTMCRKGLAIHVRHQVTQKYSLTTPTLVGQTLFVRDQKRILALDLGSSTAGEQG